MNGIEEQNTQQNALQTSLFTWAIASADSSRASSSADTTSTSIAPVAASAEAKKINHLDQTKCIDDRSDKDLLIFESISSKKSEVMWPRDIALSDPIFKRNINFVYSNDVRVFVWTAERGSSALSLKDSFPNSAQVARPVFGLHNSWSCFR